jgi:chloramphenicol-sensitive protein RarD
MNEPSSQSQVGFIASITAYVFWGFLPLYLHMVAFADPFEVLAQRILWCVPAALIAVLAVSGWTRGRGEIATALAPRNLRALALSAIFIFFNWGIYVWSVAHQRLAEASLAYFLTPLVQIAFGVAFFKERVNGAQKAALAVATIGVVLQGVAMGAPPWISIALCLTWSFYGLVRKQVEVSAASGLFIESAIVAPPAAMLIWSVAHGPGLHFGDSSGSMALLALAGPLTATPLILFAYGARRLSFTVLGPMQFATPSVQFLLAMAFGEPVTPLRWASFAIIWVALAIFMWDALSREAVRRKLEAA